MDLDDETINVIEPINCLVFLGHCAKTYAILANSLKAPHISGKKWLVIADDDTLLRYALILCLGMFIHVIIEYV